MYWLIRLCTVRTSIKRGSVPNQNALLATVSSSPVNRNGILNPAAPSAPRSLAEWKGNKNETVKSIDRFPIRSTLWSLPARLMTWLWNALLVPYIHIQSYVYIYTYNSRSATNKRKGVTKDILYYSSEKRHLVVFVFFGTLLFFVP